MEITCCWVYAINKYGYPPNLKDTYRAIEEMADLGFRNIELEGVVIEGINENNLLEINKEKKKLKKLCDDLGLKVVNFLPIIPNLISLDRQKREKALDLFNLSVEICSYFDCQLLSGDSHFPAFEFVDETPYRQTIGSCKNIKVRINPGFNWDEQWKIVVEAFSKLCEMAKKADLEFALEPRVGEIISNTDAFLRLCHEVGTDNLGMILDTGHLHAQKEILALSVEKLKDRIFYVHVSDNDSRDNRHLGLGKGTIDWPGLFSALKKHNYNGCIGIDIAEADSMDEEFSKAKGFLEGIIGSGNFASAANV